MILFLQRDVDPTKKFGIVDARMNPALSSLIFKNYVFGRFRSISVLKQNAQTQTNPQDSALIDLEKTKSPEKSELYFDYTSKKTCPDDCLCVR